VVLERDVGWSELPWATMLAWVAASAAALAALRTLLRQRVAARRAEELLRLGQVARLNQLGELAAGMAHELNQPLTALLANTQAAQRLLGDEEPDLDMARHAMSQAVAQARRASAVVGRLRRVVERPDLSGQVQALPCPPPCMMHCTCWSPSCAAAALPCRWMLPQTCRPCAPSLWPCSRSSTTW
jgi:nitrogen-specific signal transduction histidine kinase